MQKLVKPFCTDNCAFPVPLIFKLNRKIFTAFSAACLSTKLNTSLKLWISVESEDSSGYSVPLCMPLFNVTYFFGAELIPLSLIFYFFIYLPILPFAFTNDARFCPAVKKDKWKLSDWELLPFSLVQKMLLWGHKNTLKCNVLVLSSHMCVLDPAFVTSVISGWSFSSVSCHLYQHSFVFYSGPFLVLNFYT